MADDTLRIGQAARLLDVSVDTLRRWGAAGRLRVERSEGGQRRIPLGEVRRLLTDEGPPQPTITASSARNQLDAIVTGVTTGAAAASVEMRAGPYRLVALTTAESVAELGLEPGHGVVASVKATNVVVGLPEDPDRGP